MPSFISAPDAVCEISTLSARRGSTRAEALAERLERGARALASLAASLTPAEWRTPLPGDGRPVGVVVHHVASVYPIEIDLACRIARGEAMTGVTMADVHAMNARHAVESAAVTPADAVALLQNHSQAAADAIRALSDDELDRAAPASLYAGAPVTAQFVLEDHAVRHSYHHLAGIARALGRPAPVFVAALALAVSLLAVPQVVRAQSSSHHGGGAVPAPASLVKTVRAVTRPYLDVNAAVAAGYGPFLGCVSAPEIGAMGQHYVNGPLVGDGLIDATRPEALIYEFTSGKARLVGVEYIVDAATWNAAHTAPPVLDGQSFQFVGAPNRYALPAFYELHVWAWRDNPHGTFVDWNPRVTCDGQ